MACNNHTINKILVEPKTTSEAAFVLHDHSPDDVVKAMIQTDRQREPFFTFNMDVAYQSIQLFKEKMPRVQIHYAVKANDSIMMLKMAVAAGVGFDCASPGEIYKIRRLNVSPTLLIRIRIDGDSVYKLGDKFGCEFEKEATDLLDEAANLGLRVIGVAFHVGSGCFSVNTYLTALQQAKGLFDYEARAGRRMEMVDIGGGFFGAYPEKFEAVSRVINSALEELFPDSGVQIIAEPGRYLCEAGFTLYCNIKDMREAIVEKKHLKTLYINDSFHGSLFSWEPWLQIQIYGKSSVTVDELEDGVLYGPTTDHRDLIVDVKVPKCSVDNWLTIKSLGSYSVVFATQYNCIEVVKIRSLISKELWNIIKSCPVWEKSDFILNPDISAPLPSSIPSVIGKQDFHTTEVLKLQSG